MSHGLTVKDTRKLAYRYAVANKIAVFDSWIIKESAGRDSLNFEYYTVFDKSFFTFVDFP